MDLRVFEAALTGNVDCLHQLLTANPLILNSISLSSENPLHVASTAGHVDFVKEILKLKPDRANEYNQDGFSPVHTAAVYGNVEIIRELLKVDRKNYRLEGRDKRTPLHYAAMKGRTSIITEMVSACPECIQDVAFSRETALHLAVRYSQFDAICILVDSIRVSKKEHVLNMKDEQGNTALDLATRKKQRQVIELLLGSGARILEVNAINQSGLTALDVLHSFPSEAGDIEIDVALRSAGAMRSREIHLATIPSSETAHNQNSVNRSIESETSELEPNNLVDYFKFKKGRDSPSEAHSTLLVIAALVATATFQVGVNSPSGVWQENYVPNSPDQSQNQTNSSINKAHEAGESIFASYGGVPFVLFVLFNTIGFALALNMIDILTSKFPLRFELQICLVAMFFSYNITLIFVSPSDVRTLCNYNHINHVFNPTGTPCQMGETTCQAAVSKVSSVLMLAFV